MIAQMGRAPEKLTKFKKIEGFQVPREMS